jgi:cellulose synthase/poly-beta-1,6-N-acetylglucosamine synthase-like glycosyltransferase
MFGYPVLLALLAKLRHRDVRKARKLAKVSVILPVHNGEAFIGSKLESILAMNYPRELLEVLVISDGSTDRTHEIVRNFEKRANLDLIVMPRAGKAAALNAGMDRATGDIFFFTDVRQNLSRDSLANLVQCFADPDVGAASGELIIREGAGTEEASVGLYWKYEKWIRKSLSRVDSVLGATGCIYAMRRELVTPLPEGTLVDDMFLPLSAFFQGYRVILDETALAYDYPTQLASEFRRKVRTLAGVYQVIGQYPQLLSLHNRMWIHFFSHKLARLLMPWAMLVAFFASVALPAPWNTWAVTTQFAGYGLAALNLVVPDGSFVKRITAPAFTFVVLMAASLCAVSIFFVPAGTLWGHTRVSVPQTAKAAKSAPE